jgi:RNA polymerase sigma factor (sigma-70 family)
VNEWDVSTREGFMHCYRATVGDVYGYAGLLTGPDRAAAEDIVHDVYTALLARAQRGDAGVIGFGYLRRSVRNRWIDRLRAEQREQRRLAAQPQGPLHVPAVDAVDDMPVRLLAELPARERVVMVLRYVDQMPVDRIAEALGTTQRAVESVISRALGRLRREVMDNG